MEIVLLGAVGMAFGSFVNALVWRLKNKRDFVSERSECTHCHHILAWYDLIPVISWLTLRGKCRYCRKPIDDSPIVELAVAVVFGLSYAFWPLGFSTAGVTLLVLWLFALVLLAALFVYDLRWMLLPNKLMFPLIGTGVLWAIVRYGFLEGLPPLAAGEEVIYGLLSVAGIYACIYFVSKGEWIGFGDVKLGIFMGLVLGWQQGLLALVLANVIALVVVLPGLLTKKLKKTARIPFGPFLILATIIAFLFGSYLLNWYMLQAGLV